VGGLARRAGYIKTVWQAEKNILLLDVGNAFGYPGAQSRLKAETTVQAMALMSYDALNTSNLEFSFGPDFLRETTEKNNLPTLSANIVYEDTGEPVSTATRIVAFDTFTVGITGVVGKKYEKIILESSAGTARPVAVLDEMAALQKQVDAIRNRVDILIVLANTGVERAKEIAQRITGIDVIVCGHGSDEIKSYYLINGVYVVKAGYDGVNIGTLVLSLDRNKRIIEAQGEVVALEKDIDEDKDMLGLLDAYHKSLKDHVDELFTGEQHQPPSGGSYAGSEKCTGCHQSQAQQWGTTGHATAFSSLAAKNQDYNPECVVCHVTGFGYLGGFKRPDYSPEMADVQCEMCHGAGAEHAAHPATGYGAISALACINCHTSDKSPDFDYATYYQKIAH
jgi:2',3'-cyclic-nucleotide 2'-phosphodiesterase (5'-nucleotidase family)